jgi:uracil-DNA glycosylase family 4
MPSRSNPDPKRLDRLRRRIIDCERCPRLRRYCAEVARVKRKAYKNEVYWGKPVPGFGDPAARLLIVGLAPGAHGANRTGRNFTGDSSGNFLYPALYRAGFASQPESVGRNDGLKLIDSYITATCRCAPPDNKPLPKEILACRPYLEEEFRLLKRVHAILALGRIAFDGILATMIGMGWIENRKGLDFSHGVSFILGPDLPILFASYHPSPHNTSTGRLTRAMFDGVFRKIRRSLDRPRPND